MKTIGCVLGGEPGSGKTATMVAFTPQKPGGQTRRLVIDMENRVKNYQAQSYGLDSDDPARLLFVFDLYPEEGVITAEQFIELFKDLNAKRLKYDVVELDNIALFQEEMAGWCADKGTASALVEVAGLKQKFGNFIGYRWKEGEPNWWKMQKSIIKAFLLELRNQHIDFVATTELGNKWQDYGKTGKGEDGLPLQRILGRTATLWEPWKQICDVIWNLTRSADNNVVLSAPIVSLDRIVPKCSIVGCPPKFLFSTWSRIWEWETKREVPTAKKMTDLKPISPEIPVDSPVAPATEVTWGDVMSKARESGKLNEANNLRNNGTPPDKAQATLFA